LTVNQWLSFFNSVVSNPATIGVYSQLNARRGSSSGYGVFRSVPRGVTQDFTYDGPGIRYRATSEFAGEIAAEVSWLDAAIICIWLHNGRPADAALTLSGAYDTNQWRRVVTPGVGISLEGLNARQEGARFFMPTLDEWVKAAHYDPHRYGQNQGGYWLNAYSRDTAAVWARPENGGEAFSSYDISTGTALQVGAFPTVQSPWGLVDTGGAE
jgi:hypothetical protein